MGFSDGQRPAPAGTALISKAFAVLRQVSRHHHAGTTLTEIAQALGLHHATALRILRALAVQDMVAQRPGTRLYVLGPGTLELGASAHPAFDVRDRVAGALKRISGALRCSAFFNVRSGYDSVYLAREIPPDPPALPLEVGARRPLCATAGGTALLLLLGAREQAAALRYGLAQSATIGRQRVAAMKRLVKRSRARGFGVNEDLIVPGMTGIGVAAPGPRGAVGAFSITMRSERARTMGIERIARVLSEEAGALARAMAEEGPPPG